MAVEARHKQRFIARREMILQCPSLSSLIAIIEHEREIMEVFKEACPIPLRADEVLAIRGVRRRVAIDLAGDDVLEAEFLGVGFRARNVAMVLDAMADRRDVGNSLKDADEVVGTDHRHFVAGVVEVLGYRQNTANVTKAGNLNEGDLLHKLQISLSIPPHHLIVNPPIRFLQAIPQPD